jgi:hypothetical protein
MWREKMPKEQVIKTGILLKGIEADIDAAILCLKQVPGVEVIYVRKSEFALEIKNRPKLYKKMPSSTHNP